MVINSVNNVGRGKCHGRIVAGKGRVLVKSLTNATLDFASKAFLS